MNGTNYLDGFKSFERPATRATPSKYHPRETVQAFMETGEYCMGKEFGKNASYVAKAYMHQAKALGLPIVAAATRGWVYISRTDLQ